MDKREEDGKKCLEEVQAILAKYKCTLAVQTNPVIVPVQEEKKSPVVQA